VSAESVECGALALADGPLADSEWAADVSLGAFVKIEFLEEPTALFGQRGEDFTEGLDSRNRPGV
jgi:hypothetical protein